MAALTRVVPVQHVEVPIVLSENPFVERGWTAARDLLRLQGEVQRAWRGDLLRPIKQRGATRAISAEFTAIIVIESK